MEIEVTKPKRLEEGRYIGVITDVQYRTEPYTYTDVYIEVKDVCIIAGYPTVISEESKLGQLLMRFGANLIIGSMIDPDKVLIGKQCSFVVIEQESKKEKGKYYSKVVSQSVKPVESTNDSRKATESDVEIKTVNSAG